MIQVDPKKRLGRDPTSMVDLKKHPFFQGIDFQEVSSDNYTGAKDLVSKLIRGDNIEQPDDDISISQLQQQSDVNIRFGTMASRGTELGQSGYYH